MDIGFKFVNGNEVKYSVSGNLPIELVLDGGIANKNTLNAYVKSLDYLMRGVTNFASGKILGASINISHLGYVNKNGSVIDWSLKVPKYKVVTYTVSVDTIKESMYYADAILSSGKNIKPLENKELLKVNEAQLRTNIIKGVVSLGNSSLPYYYSYENDSLVLREKDTNKRIDIEDIAEDDVYIVLKLLGLYFYKSTHLSLVLVDCEGMSKNSINFIVDMCTLFQKEFGVNLLFLYNKNIDLNINTEKICLPNIF